jgi:hypothetical protein
VARRSAPSVRLLRVRDQVRGTFARVLARDAEVRIVEDKGNFLVVIYREKTYSLSVDVNEETVHLYVSKREKDADLGMMFFTYSCATSRVGPLRKTALILHKKMFHEVIHDVMEA